MGGHGIVLAALVVGLLFPGSVAGQTGIVVGRIVSAVAQLPVADVLVQVAGTNRSGVSDGEGRYRITGVPTGPQTIRATTLGYGQAESPVTVVAAQTVTVDFVLQQTAVELGGIVVNAVTGQAQVRREIANSVGTLDVTDMQLAPITSVAQLLQGRIAGSVVQQSSGTTGMGSRIRIRGSNSISLSNGPLVIIDGVRVENAENSLGFDVGGQAPSRLDDLNPEDIESIDVLRGPAASAIYGTAAANGVIIITTRRGRPGRPDFQIWTDMTYIRNVTDFPDNVEAIGLLTLGPGLPPLPPGFTGSCDFLRQAVGANPGPFEVGCSEVTEVNRFNPLENPETTPFRSGSRKSVGVSVSGGSDVATFYLSTEYEEEIGVLPQNDQKRIRVQANMRGNLGDKLTALASFSFLESDAQLPLGDDALFGIVPMGLYGSPDPAAVEAQQGFESDPQRFFDWKTFQSFSRFIGSVRTDYRPLLWLSVNANLGLDRYALQDVHRVPRLNAYADIGSPEISQGIVQDFESDIYNTTANASATAIFDLTPTLVSTTSAGGSYQREDFNQIFARGSTLTAGIEESLAGASTHFSASEGNAVTATVGAHVQEQLAWRDRVFINAALRGDRNSAFGTNVGWVWFPAVSAAWLVSDEPGFPAPGWLDNLRLRAAWGRSGLRPSSTAALESFASAIGVFENQDVAAFVVSGIGNPALQPEQSTELEGGIDAGLLQGRVGVELTYYHKTTRDALVSRPVPPSVGSSSNQFENLGEVVNRGFEFLLNGEPIRTQDYAWTVAFSGSFMSNELVDLGQDAQGNDIPPIIAGSQRHVEGEPLGSFFDLPILGFEDTDGNGLLSPDEVDIGLGEEVFLGVPHATREFSLSSQFTYRDWLRVSALLDHRAGNKLLNFTRALRCVGIFNCGEFYNLDGTLEDQAAIIALGFFGSFAGYIEDAGFTKLREVAVTIGVPQTWASRVGAERLSVTLAGRNLLTITDYKGFDPEVSALGQTNFTAIDAGTLPPNRHFVIRFDANF